MSHVPNTSIYTSVGWFLTNCEPVSTLVPFLKTRPGSGLVPVNPPNQAAPFYLVAKFQQKEKLKIKNSTIK